MVMFTGSLYRETGLEAWAIGEEPPPSLMFPLNQIQNNGRPIAVILLVGGAMMVVLGKHSYSPMPSWVAALIAVQGILVLKLFLSTLVTYGLLSLVVYVLSYILFGIGVPSWIKEDGNSTWAFRSLGIAAAIFALANLAQAVVDPAPLLHGGRFRGTTGNAQHAGLLLALSTVILAYLVSTPTRRRLERIFWLGALIATSILLIWTGSRTAALMVFVSLLILFRKRLNFLAVFATAGALAIGFILYQASGIVELEFVGMIKADKLTRLDDTRSLAWLSMWNGFMDYPIFGVPQDPSYGRLGFGENAWLAMACSCGVLGLLPLLMLGACILHSISRLKLDSLAYKDIPNGRDAIVAGLSALLVGSIFEATFLGVITYNVPFLYVAMAIADHFIATHAIARVKFYRRAIDDQMAAVARRKS